MEIVKKYKNEIITGLICLLVGFGSGWFGCKQYISYQVNKTLEEMSNSLKNLNLDMSVGSDTICAD